MSKALELIRTLIDGANEYEKKTGNTNPTVYLSKNNLLIIEQALLKQQELPEPFKTGVDIGVIKPKQYLKWEDLEFNHTPKMIDVKMNGNKYKLVVGYNVAGNNLAILRDGKKEYYFLECDKQFFNDLHLEMVEE